MRIVIQKVKKASVTVEGKRISEIENGLLVLLGIENEDTVEDISYLVKKMVQLRNFQRRKRSDEPIGKGCWRRHFNC